MDSGRKAMPQIEATGESLLNKGRSAFDALSSRVENLTTQKLYRRRDEVDGWQQHSQHRKLSRRCIGVLVSATFSTVVLFLYLRCQSSSNQSPLVSQGDEELFFAIRNSALPGALA